MKIRDVSAATRATLVALAAVTAATSVSAQDRVLFRLSDHSAGRTSTSIEPPLNLRLVVQRTGLRISGADRSEICVEFENPTRYDWTGGYRLTDRDVRDTHASLKVPAYGTARRCETLNPQMTYYLILRRD